MSDELKPCPFCGSQPKTRTESGDERTGYADTFKIQCSGCGITVQASGDTSKPGYADNSNNQKRATERWNRRATPPSPSTAPTQQDQANVLPPFAAPAGQHDADFDALLGDIMNLPCKLADSEFASRTDRLNYKLGHRDARYAAIDLVSEFARRCRAQGGVTNSELSSTAPTVEVDELPPLPADVMRALSDARSLAMKNVLAARIPESGDFGAIAQDLDWAIGQICRASKPPAREAAERQSIDTRDFRIVLDNWAGALHSYDHRTRTVYAKQAYNALIAHIDTWGGAAKGESDGR